MVDRLRRLDRRHGRDRAGRAATSGVRVLDLPRIGKAGALNTAVDAATGEILVFSDANSMFARDALRGARRAVRRPRGRRRRRRPALPAGGGAPAAMAEGERGYWDLDRLLKQAESRAAT